jgi:integrase
MPPDRLTAIAESYLLCRPTVSQRHAAMVRSVARRLDAFASDDWRDVRYLCDWLRYLASSGRSLATLADYRRIALSLYRHAHELRLIDALPRVPPVRVPRPVPEAWSVEQVSRLVQVAGLLRGRIGWCRAIPACRYFAALIQACWYTAERIGAILHLRWADLNATQGYLHFRDTKTRVHIVRPIPRHVVVLILALPRVSEYIFPAPANHNHLYRVVRRLIHDAGLGVSPGRFQLFHRIRRSAVTAVAQQYGLSAASALAGHSDPRITLRHYIDPRLVASPQVIVPRLMQS